MPDGENEGGRADGDIADFGGIDTAKGKHLDKAQQDEITAIGEKLGRKVVYEDFYSIDKFKSKKKIPDGYLAKETTDGYVKILTVSSKERDSLQISKLIGISKEKFNEKYGKKIERDTGSLRGLSDNSENSNPSTTAQLTAGTLSTDIIDKKTSNVNNNISNSDQNNTQADPNGPANFMPEGENEGEVGRADGDIADFGGIDTAKGKHLNKAQQDEITAIGEKLDRKVVYEDFYSLDKFKGKKKIPDGYLAKDGTVHINYYAKRPVYFLFKHEITHYLKRTLASYNDFMNLVIDSNAFKGWLDRNGYSSIDALKTEIMDTYSEVEGFDEERCYDEILANFVGEYLFGGENAVSQKLINALEPKQKKTFREVINDIINYFKSKFQKNKPIQTEIDKIENEFIKVYKEAVEVKESGEIEERYAIYNHRGNLVEVDWDSDNFSSLSQQLQNHLEEVNNMQPIDKISFKSTTGKELYTQVVDSFKKFGFKVDVQNFGTIELNENEIDLAVKSYINTDAEAAALLSIPRVLKRGKIISGHQNHKNRNYPTITFAAPVELNGKVGNVVVAVKVTGKTRYNAHRVLMPDGTEFVLDKEKNTESQSARVTYKNEGQRSAKDSVSNNKLTQPELIVKDNISEDGDIYSIPSSTSAESLLESYENGEISRQEYLNALRKEKNLNPLEIANLSERDADTTPEQRAVKQNILERQQKTSLKTVMLIQETLLTFQQIMNLLNFWVICKELKSIKKSRNIF